MALTTLQTDYNAATTDALVIAQVSAAIHQFGETVATEATATPNHANRSTFATKVATGQQSLAPLILSAVSFATITTASADTVAQNAVASLWNLWSGGM